MDSLGNKSCKRLTGLICGLTGLIVKIIIYILVIKQIDIPVNKLYFIDQSTDGLLWLSIGFIFGGSIAEKGVDIYSNAKGKKNGGY
jgi:hypothetical protein